MEDPIEPPAKRQRQHYERHHVLQHRLQKIASNEPALLEQETLDKLLIDGIKTIIEEQGLRNDVQEPAIESLALEALRNLAEEFTIKLCATVRRSMQASRRTVPIACDFESVAQALDRQIPQEELLTYRTKSDVNPPLLPTPPPEDAFHNSTELPASFLGPGLDNRDTRRKDAFIPSSLPTLPSQHTYKATAVFPPREKDPRRLRELATEEGKLGEQALRKLAGAVKLENTFHAEPEVRTEVPRARNPRRRKKQTASTDLVFEETMRDLLAAEPVEAQNSFEVGPVVSSEKRFWRPDDSPVKRRPVGKTMTAESGLSSHSKGKQRAVPSDETVADIDFEL